MTAEEQRTGRRREPALHPEPLRGARKKGQMGSALKGPLRISCFLAEGLFGVLALT